MNTSNIFENHSNGLFSRLPAIRMRRGLAFGLILFAALIAFESFNFSTTDFALRDLLGDLRFAGLRWATILSLAFCGIDFAGIARLFSPDQEGAKEANEVWYLFGAWLLAATMNAILTWWGVSMAILNHPTESSAVIDPTTLMKVVPVFVAVMVWLIRILIIGSLSYTGERLFTGQSSQSKTNLKGAAAAQERYRQHASNAYAQSKAAPAVSAAPANPSANAVYPVRPAPKPALRPEPTYQNVALRGSDHSNPAVRR